MPGRANGRTDSQTDGWTVHLENGQGERRTSVRKGNYGLTYIFSRWAWWSWWSLQRKKSLNREESNEETTCSIE